MAVEIAKLQSQLAVLEGEKGKEVERLRRGLIAERAKVEAYQEANSRLVEKLANVKIPAAVNLPAVLREVGHLFNPNGNSPAPEQPQTPPYNESDLIAPPGFLAFDSDPFMDGPFPARGGFVGAMVTSPHNAESNGEVSRQDGQALFTTGGNTQQPPGGVE